MSKIRIIMATLLAVALASPAMAADFKFSGDLNHRFMLYTDQGTMYDGVESVADPIAATGAKQPIKEDGVKEFWGDIKYRLTTEGATNDGKVKGVYAIELGAVRFGDSTKGGGFSGDGINIETRLAYTDFQLPGVESKARVTIGLQPFSVNRFVWQETAMGVQLAGDVGDIGYKLAWMRGREFFNDDDDDDLLEDIDSFLARGDIKPAEGVKLGLFALYQRADSRDGGDDSNLGNGYELKQFGASEFGIYTLGVDGSFTTPTGYGNAFVNWDLMYQGGDIDNDLSEDQDVSAYFAHVDVGVNMGKTRLTYTGWYASGDDDDDDGDFENFLATDVDTFDSVIFFEGGFTDDNYFTEAPYILNKGLIFNKLAVDYKATEKTAFGAAVLYLMTAEDLTLADGSKEDKLGTEIDAYVSHKLYPNVEVALNAGYLFADDAMGFWTDTGDDEDVFRSTMRVRYKF